MPVTNFQSVISTQSVGTADVDKLAASFDKMSASIDGATQKANKVNDHPGFAAFAEKVKQGIEDPLAAIGGAAESMLTALGPVGAGVAAVGATFAAAGLAAFQAAKSLGDYGTQIQNVALRTGLSSKEVEQFSFAAKLAGQDVSVFESAMRKLSQGLDDNSAEGAKARKGLGDLGVVSRDATGALRPMSDIFIQISHGLNGIEDPAKRNTEALRVFGRAGIELMPTMLGLEDRIKRAKELGLGATDEDLKRWETYHQHVTEAEVLWERFTRKIKEPLAAAITILFQDSGGRTYSLEDLAKRGVNLGQWAPRTQFGNQQAAKEAGFGAGAEWSTNITKDDVLSWTDRIEARKRTDASIDALTGRQTLAEQLREAESTLSGLQRPTKGSSTQADVDAYSDAQRKVEGLKAQIKATKDLTEAQKALAELGKQSSEIFLKAMFGDAKDPLAKYTETLGRIDTERAAFLQKNPQPAIAGEADAYYKEQRNAAKLTLDTETDKLFADFDKKGEEINRHILTLVQELGRTTLKLGEDFYRENPDLFGTNRKPFLTGQATPEQALRDARDNERRSLGLYGGQAALAGVSEIDQIGAMELLRQRSADEEYAAMKRLADVKNDEQARQDAIDQQHQKYLDAEIERQQALLQLALRQKEEFQTLATGLFDSILHGGTTGFLKQQGQQILDKIVGNAAGMAWGDVSKIIPHAGDPNSTLGKLLGGTMFGADPLKAATDLNTQATIENTAALRARALSPSGGGGSSNPYGGFSSAAGTFARLGGSGEGDGAETWGLPTDGSPGDWGGEYSGGGGAGAGSGGGMTVGKGLGYAAAAAAAGYGAYSGFKAGGAQGALAGTGSLLGAASMIPGPQQPFVMAAAMATTLIASLLGDPKQNRAKDLATQAQERSYTMPTGADYSLDAGGGYTDYDYTGRNRAVNVTNNVYAMDSTSFQDFLIANPNALSAGLTSAIQSGNADDVVGSLSARSN